MNACTRMQGVLVLWSVLDLCLSRRCICGVGLQAGRRNRVCIVVGGRASCTVAAIAKLTVECCLVHAHRSKNFAPMRQKELQLCRLEPCTGLTAVLAVFACWAR
jgi:hypothetical protein